MTALKCLCGCCYCSCCFFFFFLFCFCCGPEKSVCCAIPFAIRVVTCLVAICFVCVHLLNHCFHVSIEEKNVYTVQRYKSIGLEENKTSWILRKDFINGLFEMIDVYVWFNLRLLENHTQTKTEIYKAISLIWAMKQRPHTNANATFLQSNWSFSIESRNIYPKECVLFMFTILPARLLTKEMRKCAKNSENYEELTVLEYFKVSTLFLTLTAKCVPIKSRCVNFSIVLSVTKFFFSSLQWHKNKNSNKKRNLVKTW